MMTMPDIEGAARRACLKAFGEAAGTIGFDKPLGSYSEDDALSVIDAIVTCYSQAMVEHHDARLMPPLQSIPNHVIDRLADLDDSIPF